MTDYKPTWVDEQLDRQLWTYRDVVDHLIDFIGRTAGDADPRECKRAAAESLRELVNVHTWYHYYAPGRITTAAEYSTGTITYDHTGGTYEREVTLASGTWPSNAALCELLISSVPYEVATRESDSVITLSAARNPGSDVAAGTSYTLQQESYVLPLDFVRLFSTLVDVNNNVALRYIEPKDWLFDQRWLKDPGFPLNFTIMGSPNYQGALAVHFAQPPSSARPYDFVYLRSAREMKLFEETSGTVDVTSGSTSVTGNSTSFTSDMVGSVLRVSASSTAPTNRYGSNPYDQERIITAVASGTSATVDAAWATTRSGSAFAISDPLDVDLQTMLNAYLRCCEKNLSRTRRPQDRQLIEAAYRDELMTAKCADNRMRGTRVAGRRGGRGFIDTIHEFGSVDSDIT